MKLVSACLLGVHCRYDCQEKSAPSLIDLAKSENLLPVCPEQLGGLSTPRPPAEQKGDQVFTNEGKDVTSQYNKGAYEVLELVEKFNIREAYLKSKSPMCGSGKVYDGSFTGKLINGDGVLTKLLRNKGVKIINSDDI